MVPFQCYVIRPNPYAIDVLVHLGKAVKPHRQCPALNANGLIPIVSLTVLHLNEMGLRSVGMRHY